MEIKDVYTALEKLDNGADLIAAIKAETNKLSNEAKTHRQSGEKSSAKVKALLESLGLEDSDDVAEKAKELKTTLDSFSQDGKKPSDVARQIAELTKTVHTTSTQLKAMTEKAEAEKTKRLAALVHSKAVDALTKGNAASPENMAKLIADKLIVGDDESISYKDGDKTMSLDEGVKGWLGENAWAVKANGQQGGGSSGGSGGEGDPFLAGFNS